MENERLESENSTLLAENTRMESKINSDKYRVEESNVHDLRWNHFLFYRKMSKFDQYIQKVLGSSMHSIELDITVVDETFLVSPNASQYAYMEAKNESVFEVFENISDIDSESII